SFAAANIPVFPCRPADEEVPDADGVFQTFNVKSPLTHHGLRDATTTTRILERWWRDRPDALVGVPTGARSGFWVLDVDGAEGEAQLAALIAANGPLPTTRTVNTPSGGRHLLFALPGDREVRNRGRLAAKVDVRGEGGYIIGAGSV